MKIAHDVLRRFVDVPDDVRELRLLLDDLGLEVKRIEGDPAVFTLELLANRGDHHAYDGVAREIGVRTGAALRLPVSEPLTAGSSPVPLRLESPLCLRYTATAFEAVTPGHLPADARRVLAAAGLHEVSGPVDATNVVNLELGQPAHAFDADAIEGAIVLRTARPGEKAWPLFAPAPVAVPDGALLVCDATKVLAVAGVIGCEESKATAATRRIVLEVAAFDPVAVRRAARAMGLSTDASARFERGCDPSRVLLAAARVAALLEAAGWRRLGPTGDVGDWRDPARSITIRTSRAASFLGVPLDAATAAAALGRGGFSVHGDDDGDRLHVRVPAHRLWDVEFEADLHEELAKAVSYAATPTELPPVGLGALPTPAEARRARVEEVLLGAGFFEVYTDGFYGRSLVATLGVEPDHALARHVETSNAVDRAYALLKNNALAQAVDAVAVNERRKLSPVRMFEWTRTFRPVDDLLPARPELGRPPCTERRLLWAIAAGRDRDPAWDDRSRPADLYFFAGLVAEIGREIGVPLRLAHRSADHPLAPFLHPGRSAAVVLDEATVGIVGEVHPSVLKRFKLKHLRPTYLELDETALMSEGVVVPYAEPPVLQPVVRALAFTLPPKVEAGEIGAWLEACGPESLLHVRIADAFVHDDAGVPVRTVTFELVLSGAEDRPADTVNAEVAALVDEVTTRYGPRGVRLRS